MLISDQQILDLVDQKDCSNEYNHLERCRALEIELIKAKEKITELTRVAAENKSLEEEIRLLRNRFECMENTLHVQEKRNRSNESEEQLLRAWRHQVIRLLIERAIYVEISIKERYANKEQIHRLMDELKSHRNENEALTRKLLARESDLEAKSQDCLQANPPHSHRLQLSNNSNTRLTESIKSTLYNLHTNLITLSDYWRLLFAGDEGIDSSPLMRRLRRLERRLQCLNGRLPMVRVLLSRKWTREEGVQRVSCGIQATSSLRLTPINSPLPSNTEDLKEILMMTQNELALTIADRDFISKKLLSDADDHKERLNDLKRRHSHEVTLLKHKLEEAEKSLREMILELERMKERAERLEADRDRVVSEAMEEKVKLERDLTDTKADLAKAIISARRAERMAMQAKNEREEQVSALESEYKEKIEQLEEAKRESARELLLRPHVARPAFLRPGELFLCSDHREYSSPMAISKMVATPEESKVKTESMTSDKMSHDQLETIRKTLDNLVALAKQLEQ